MILSTDLAWAIFAFTLTLLVFSYLLGDNPLFRIATYIFVGVAAGYMAVMVIYQVILPKLLLPLTEGVAVERLLALVPLGLGLLLLFKLFPRAAWLGNIPMGLLVGAGAGVMVGGAVMGTLVDQVLASINLFDRQYLQAQQADISLVLAEGIFILTGTICTLIYFHFGARTDKNGSTRRFIAIEGLGLVGQVFIAMTLGALYAGAYLTALAALIERMDFMLKVLYKIFV